MNLFGTDHKSAFKFLQWKNKWIKTELLFWYSVDVLLQCQTDMKRNRQGITIYTTVIHVLCWEVILCQSLPSTEFDIEIELRAPLSPPKPTSQLKGPQLSMISSLSSAGNPTSNPLTIPVIPPPHTPCAEVHWIIARGGGEQELYLLIMSRCSREFPQTATELLLCLQYGRHSSHVNRFTSCEDPSENQDTRFSSCHIKKNQLSHSAVG